MPHYVTVQLEMKDPAVFDTYRAKAGAALAKYGAQQLAGGPNTEVLEDTGAGPATVVVLTFPDADAARGWINDPDLQEVHALRQAGAKTMITMLPPVA